MEGQAARDDVPVCLVASLCVSRLAPSIDEQLIIIRPNDLASISLWAWLGPWALLLWLPPIVMRLEPGRA